MTDRAFARRRLRSPDSGSAHGSTHQSDRVGFITVPPPRTDPDMARWQRVRLAILPTPHGRAPLGTADGRASDDTSPTSGSVASSEGVSETAAQQAPYSRKGRSCQLKPPSTAIPWHTNRSPFSAPTRTGSDHIALGRTVPPPPRATRFLRDRRRPPSRRPRSGYGLEAEPILTGHRRIPRIPTPVAKARYVIVH